LFSFCRCLVFYEARLPASGKKPEIRSYFNQIPSDLPLRYQSLVFHLPNTGYQTRDTDDCLKRKSWPGGGDFPVDPAHNKKALTRERPGVKRFL
jgi:hypothetical protein